jgi:acetate kinase
MAIKIFCYRLRKYIAAYIGALGGVDGIAFAGGIGENSDIIRLRAVEGLKAPGLVVDAERNRGIRGAEAEISPPGARSRVFVVPTNEELLIARDTYSIVSASSLS